MLNGALAELGPDRFFVGHAPYSTSPTRFAQRPALYWPSFALDTPQPWFHPREWEILSLAELRANYGGTVDLSPPRATWEAMAPDGFAREFADIQTQIAAGRLEKVVPVVFERGEVQEDRRVFDAKIFSRLLRPAPGLHKYYARDADQMTAGLTPELLFVAQENEIRTMALAGTRAAAHGEDDLRAEQDFLHDPKERQEHEFVVRDITERLRSLGEVEAGETFVFKLPTLWHLKTPLRVRCAAERPSFAELVRALHPTAALGQYPREPRRAVDPARGNFGAPWGLELPTGEAWCAVAIRNLRRRGSELRVGAGCGVVRESRLDREWRELQLKRNSLKGRLGL